MGVIRKQLECGQDQLLDQSLEPENNFGASLLESFATQQKNKTKQNSRALNQVNLSLNLTSTAYICVTLNQSLKPLSPLVSMGSTRLAPALSRYSETSSQNYHHHRRVQQEAVKICAKSMRPEQEDGQFYSALCGPWRPAGQCSIESATWETEYGSWVPGFRRLPHLYLNGLISSFWDRE